MNVKLLSGIFFCVGLSLSVNIGYADEAPVVDASSSYQAKDQSPDENEAPVADSSKSTIQESSDESVDETHKIPALSELSSMPTDKRVQRLEQQVNNIANMNLPEQITLLQQQIAQLRGQLEVQEHDLQLNNKQLRSFYQDLSNRINQMNNLNAGNTNSAASDSNNKVLVTPTSVELQDANAYQIAFGQLVNHQLDKSKQSFDNYINQYPNGKYVADAHYWLGEIYMTNKDYKNANNEFETVLSKYPNSAKIADSKLKIAIIHANTGKVDQAKNELQSIKKAHPESTAAQLANIRLQQLDEGPDLAGQ